MKIINKNKDGDSNQQEADLPYQIYVKYPVICALVWFATCLLMTIPETMIARYAIAIPVALLILIYTIFLTRRISKLYSGFSRWLASIYLWFFCFILITMTAAILEILQKYF